MWNTKSNKTEMCFRLMVLAFGALLVVAPALMAQTASTGALTGTVTDPSGAAIPNATITLTSTSGAVRTATTGADGGFKFSLLVPGTYRVKFAAMGFNAEEVPAAQVDVSETEVLNRTLSVGSQSQSVTVEATVEAVQTQNSALGTVMRSQTVVELPLSTRNYTNLISLSAGANGGVNNAAVLGQGAPNVAVNGASTLQNNFQVDGVNGTLFAGTNTLSEGGGNSGEPPIPNPDSIEQFKIQTSTYDASYGRNSGANVNVVTKSGTNAFHGTMFEFFRNTVLNANDFFLKKTQLSAGQPNKQAVLNQNQYGGVIGGPIKKDKLFFFISYQETFQKNGFDAKGSASGLRFAPIPSGNRGTCPAGVLTIAQMQTQCDAATQTFVAALGAATCPIGFSNPGCTNADTLSVPNRNVYCTAAQAAAKTVVNGTTCIATGQRNTGVDVNASGNNINPQAIRMLQLKLPNGNYYIPGSGTSTYTPSGNTITLTDPVRYREHQGVGNWDYVINSKHTFSGKYFFLTNPSVAPFAGNNFLPGISQASEFGNQFAVLKITSILTNNVVNEVKAGYNRHTLTISQLPLSFTAPQVGMTGISPGGPYEGLPTIIISGMYTAGENIQGIHNIAENTPSIADLISWSHGKQTIRAGVEYSNTNYKWLQRSYQIGTFTFQRFGDFLLGLPGCTSVNAACLAGAAQAQAGGPGLLPASYSPFGTATNGTTFSNIDNVGQPSNRTDPAGLLHYFSSGEIAAFLQDDVKINSRLTINLGLRWEYDKFVEDKYGDATNQWVSLINLQPIPGSGCVINGVSYGLGAAATTAAGGIGCSFQGYEVPSNFSTARWGPLPAGVYQNSRKDPTVSGPPKDNFAPRVGFAWQPLSTNRLVVRGGGGYFYDRIAGGNLGPPINQQPPYVNSINQTGTANFGASLVQPFAPGPLAWTPRWTNFTNGTSSNFNPAGGQGPITPGLLTPLTYNYNLQVQYEFLPTWVLEVGYVGSHAIHQEVPNPINAAPLASAANPLHCGYNGGDPSVLANCVTTNATSGANGPAVRSPYLGFNTSFHTASSTGGYKFNSLQATVRKNFSHGLSMNAAYTWSRAFLLNYVGNPDASFANNVPVIQQYGLNGDYRPQRLVLNYSWLLPFGTHKGFVDKMVSGWTLSGVTTIQSGTPMTLTDTNTGTIFGSPGAPVISMAQFVSGKTAADALTPGSVQSKLGNYFNTSAFVLTSAGLPLASTLTGCTVATCPGTLYGNSGQGIVRGPNQQNWDITLSKNTKVGGLREDARLEFRVEFFNAFNHPQFTNPNLVASGTSFGKITTTSVNPRFLQFGLKYAF